MAFPDLIVNLRGVVVQDILTAGEQVALMTGDMVTIAFEGSDIIRTRD